MAFLFLKILSFPLYVYQENLTFWRKKPNNMDNMRIFKYKKKQMFIIVNLNILNYYFYI